MATPEKLIKKILKSNIDRRPRFLRTKNNSLKGVKQDDIHAAIQLIFENIKMSLYKGSRVEVRGFGHFDPVQYAARKARNPKTGEPVPIDARRVVVFTPSKQLKDGVKKRLNNKNYDYANDAEMQNFYAKNY